MRILLVEDDKNLAAYLLKALSEIGAVTDHAADGREGLFMAAGNQYDVMIVDRMLPELDGLTIIGRQERGQLTVGQQQLSLTIGQHGSQTL